MRTLDQQLNYEQLELIARHPTPRVPAIAKRATSFFQFLCQSAIHQLTRRNEPRIWTSTIKSGPQTGQKMWHLYDPITQQRQTMASEQEVRHWLDTRYYR